MLVVTSNNGKLIIQLEWPNEGDSDYNLVDPLTVWLCVSSVWKPHR